MFWIQGNDFDVLVEIVGDLSAGGRNGVALTSLASRVNVLPGRLESLLDRHSEYFVRVGSESRYTLNRFGRFAGSEARILSDIERIRRQHKRQQILLPLLASLAAVAGAIAWLQIDCNDATGRDPEQTVMASAIFGFISTICASIVLTHIILRLTL